MADALDLSTEFCGIRFKNPVWTASGCFGYGREFAKMVPPDALGAMCVKGTSKEPWFGNPGTRVVETPGGMLNAIGLQNPGVDHFLEVDWPWLREHGATVIVNIVGKTVADYVAVAERLEGSGVAALELNISCPNVKEGGMVFGTNLPSAYEVTSSVRKATTLPLMVKLSPNVSNIVDFAKAVEDAGADAVTLINTLQGMSIDIRRRRPQLGNVFGGLSGPGIKPVALRMVWQVAGAVKIPVVGIGGIMTGEDAVEYLMAGARAIEVGTACFANPKAPMEIVEGIAAFMRETGVTRVTDLIGAARPEVEWRRPPASSPGGAGTSPGATPGAPGGATSGAEAGATPGASQGATPGATPGAGAAKHATGATAEALRQFLKDADRA